MVTGESFTCVCKEGWEGPTCTQSKCTLNCEWEIDGQVLLFKDDRCPATLCKVLHLIILDSPIPSVLQYFFFPFHLPSLAAAGHEKGGGGRERGYGKWRQMFLPLVQHTPVSALSLLHSCPNSDMSACSAAPHFPGIPALLRTHSKT